MPNGGTDCCINCSNNRANSTPHDFKAGDRSSRLPFCMLRLVGVYDRAWNFGENFTHRAEVCEVFEPIGSIYATGVMERGYVRIPWYGIIEPSLQIIESFAICKQENKNGISITIA